MIINEVVDVPDLGKFIDWVYAVKQERDQLRAMLIAPAATVVPATSQPQYEPIAWRVTGRGGLTVTPEYPKWATKEPGLTVTPLYAERSVLEALVLPERREETGTGGASFYIPVGWNACLDELARLNHIIARSASGGDQ